MPRVPLQPPEAVHEVAFVDVHESETVPLVATSRADVFSDTVAGGGVAADPPPPAHAPNRMDAKPIGMSPESMPCMGSLPLRLCPFVILKYSRIGVN